MYEELFDFSEFRFVKLEFIPIRKEEGIRNSAKLIEIEPRGSLDKSILDKNKQSVLQLNVDTVPFVMWLRVVYIVLLNYLIANAIVSNLNPTYETHYQGRFLNLWKLPVHLTFFPELLLVEDFEVVADLH